MNEKEILLAGEHGVHQHVEVCFILLIHLLGTSVCLGGCLIWF